VHCRPDPREPRKKEQAVNELRQSIRYPLAVQRECSLCLITFKNLSWTDHTAQLKDISRDGIGIESELAIERGFVWFRDRVGGHRGGVLMWSRQHAPNFRAGIQFVPLSRSEEQYVQEEVAMLRGHAPLRNPEAIIATIMESLNRKSKRSQ
jgi:hypothetical protein